MNDISKYIIIILLFYKITYSQIFVGSLDTIPSTWKGSVFQLSKDYPKDLPVEKNQPWLQYDFKTQPLEYINAVLKYIYEGNIEVNWKIQNNRKRKWYHAPSMIWGKGGREFIHGLTQERFSRPFDLHPNQKNWLQNWAVGFYNPLGGYIIGKVWSDSTNPVLSEGIFPEGTVAAKLLFSEASIENVPYLKGSYEWQAYIIIQNKKQIQTLRLLQLDIAVKDSRANSSTGWVFGTFVYSSNVKGKTVWDRMVLVGLSWGNDPDKIENQDILEESWINPEFIKLFTFEDGSKLHTGYKNRLNGPVDDPTSSCISCHSQAQIPNINKVRPDTSDLNSVKKYFRNIKSGDIFEQSQLPANSLDYSLQLSRGVGYVLRNKEITKTDSAIVKKDTLLTITTLNDEKISREIDSLRNTQTQDTLISKPIESNKFTVIIIIIIALLIIVIVIILIKYRKQKHE